MRHVQHLVYLKLQFDFAVIFAKLYFKLPNFPLSNHFHHTKVVIRKSKRINTNLYSRHLGLDPKPYLIAHIYNVYNYNGSIVADAWYQSSRNSKQTKYNLYGIRIFKIHELYNSNYTDNISIYSG